MEPQDPPKRKRLTAAVRRQLILDAARQVFSENGLAGGRLRDIADRAGITEAYLYRHFTSKAELYQAALHAPMEQIVDDFAAQVQSVIDGPPVTGIEVVYRINEMMLEFMLAAVPYLGVALFSDVGTESSFYKTTIYPKVHEKVGLLLRGIKGWPAKGIDLDIVVNSMWGLNYGIALDALLRGHPVDVAKTTERVTRLYAAGIADFKRPRALAK